MCEVMHLKKRPCEVQQRDEPEEGIIGNDNIGASTTDAVEILLGVHRKIQNKQKRRNDKEDAVPIALQIAASWRQSLVFHTQ